MKLKSFEPRVGVPTLKSAIETNGMYWKINTALCVAFNIL